jgi:hypothetical protein
VGIQGSITSAVSGTSVTVPSTKVGFIGVGVYAATVSGYCTIIINPARSANFLFQVPIGVTTADNPTVQQVGPLGNGIWPFSLSTGAVTLNYSGTGLTSGTFVFYYGTPLPGSQPLQAYQSIVQSYTTGALGAAFSFPSEITLTGAAHTFGTSTVQTILQDRISFNTSAGFSITLSFSMLDAVIIIPLEATAAQSLTVTNTLTGTGVGTGYVALYYK